MIGVNLMNEATLFNELLSTIIRGLVIPVIPVVTTYIVSVINKYTEEITSKLDSDTLAKYTLIAETAIVTSIYTVYQTYIDDILRRNDKLSPEEINTAFTMIKEKSKNLIGEAIAMELENKYKDLDTWLENKISFFLNSQFINPYTFHNNELEGML